MTTSIGHSSQKEKCQFFKVQDDSRAACATATFSRYYSQVSEQEHPCASLNAVRGRRREATKQSPALRNKEIASLRSQ